MLLLIIAVILATVGVLLIIDKKNLIRTYGFTIFLPLLLLLIVYLFITENT